MWLLEIFELLLWITLFRLEGTALLQDSSSLQTEPRPDLGAYGLF